jgi:hypothetical protein
MGRLGCRLENLEAQCQLWHGVIAAAVYVPLTGSGDVLQPGYIDKDGYLADRSATPAPLAVPISELVALHQRVERSGAQRNLNPNPKGTRGAYL